MSNVIQSYATSPQVPEESNNRTIQWRTNLSSIFYSTHHKNINICLLKFELWLFIFFCLILRGSRFTSDSLWWWRTKNVCLWWLFTFLKKRFTYLNIIWSVPASLVRKGIITRDYVLWRRSRGRTKIEKELWNRTSRSNFETFDANYTLSICISSHRFYDAKLTLKRS